MFTRYELLSLIREIVATHSSVDEIEADEVSNALVDFCVEELGIDVEEDSTEEEFE